MNAEIKEAIRKSRFFKYEIARKIGITEETFSRWFRAELTEDQKEKIKSAIEELKKEL